MMEEQLMQDELSEFRRNLEVQARQLVEFVQEAQLGIEVLHGIHMPALK